MNCILNVTDYEYDQILQWNHDAVVWKTKDGELMERLPDLVGAEVVEEMQLFDECRMEKHHELPGPRVEPETAGVPTRIE